MICELHRRNMRVRNVENIKGETPVTRVFESRTLPKLWTYNYTSMPFSMLQPLRDLPIAVVDTETTGASAAFGHKIIEIGVVRIENGREVARYQQLLDPKRRITPGVTAFTGITQAMCTGQPRFADQLEPMLAILKDAAILGHNIRFDLSFLHAEFRRAKLDMNEVLGPIPILDTVRIARK